MATTEATARQSRERTAWLILAGCGLLLGGMVLFAYLNRPPQMGTSEDVFKTVDALYTAVRSQDEKRLGECAQRLHGYRDTGKLAPAAAEALDAIIQRAKAGSWRNAAEHLYEFMLAQRREGASEPQHQDRKGKASKRQTK